MGPLNSERTCVGCYQEEEEEEEEEEWRGFGTHCSGADCETLEFRRTTFHQKQQQPRRRRRRRTDT